MYHLTIATILILAASLWGGAKQDNSAMQEKFVLAQMRKVCDWQLDNLPDIAVKSDGKTEPIFGYSWHRAAFLTGLMATYYTTADEKYLIAATSIAEENGWQLGPRERHGDDHCVAQTYAEIYFLKKDPRMLAATIETFDKIVADPMLGPEVGWQKKINWSWCDALFMAPPAFARVAKATGDHKYLDVMDTMWWATTDHLYDPDEHLYFRDANYKINPDGSGPRTQNGHKIFWGRGNGWVMAGIARVLQFMPDDYPTRARYIRLFREMADKIATLQQPDGLWRASLLDPEEFPARETSSSGFFCYALAWGVNNGLLAGARFDQVIRAAWRGLLDAVEESGKLGWVQRVGRDPRSVSKDDTMEYGVGAFLLAASEIVKMPRSQN